MNSKINKLKNGQSIEISRSNGQWVTAEKSGNGKVVRFIRHTENSFRVFRTIKA